jgi:hypothetical protein
MSNYKKIKRQRIAPPKKKQYLYPCSNIYFPVYCAPVRGPDC